MQQWDKFKNTGSFLNYRALFNEEESALYAKVNTAVTTECQFVYVPQLVKGTLCWEDYAAKIKAIEGVDEMVAAFQNHVAE